MMETVRLELPIPPLVNHYWRHITIKGTPRTLISARGRDFRKNVMQIVGDEKKALKIDSRVKVNVVVCPPDRRMTLLPSPEDKTFQLTFTTKQTDYWKRH